MAGCFFPKPVACSNAWTICRTLKSCRSRPTICTPTGSPSGVKPPGTEAAGLPVAEIVPTTSRRDQPGHLHGARKTEGRSGLSIQHAGHPRRGGKPLQCLAAGQFAHGSRARSVRGRFFPGISPVHIVLLEPVKLHVHFEKNVTQLGPPVRLSRRYVEMSGNPVALQGTIHLHRLWLRNTHVILSNQENRRSLHLPDVLQR